MFDLPAAWGVAKVVLDEHNIDRDTKPLLVYRDQAKVSAA
jgi:ATP-dependent Clp protease ATP-binding subunit ClpX